MSNLLIKAIAARHHPSDSGYSPGSDPNIEFWYSAPDLGLSDLDSVSPFYDISDNGRNLSQGTPANKPTFRTNIINGLPIVRFDGSNDSVSVSGFTISQPITYYGVIRINAILSSSRYIFDATSSTIRNFFYTNSTAPDWRMNAGSGLTGGTPAISTNYIINCVFNGASSLLEINGSSILSGDAGSGSLSGLTVGARYSLDNWASFDLGELFALSEASDLTKRQEVISYLSNRWSIAIS